MTDSFPRQQARTRNFSLGAPRSFQISPDGGTVAFLRSPGGTDPVTGLWALDVAAGTERLVADPAQLAGFGGEDDELEKARRERTRERAEGIVGFATDAGFTVAAFTLAGRVYLAPLALAGEPGPARELPTRVPAADPRPDPSGRLVAYTCAGALRVVNTETGEDRAVIDPDGAAGISFGAAEFLAAEEMGRTRGYWWAPDSGALLVARVDENPVPRWHIADPAHPAAPAREIRYPSAGTPNAEVTAFIASVAGKLTRVVWDGAAFPYLVTACWSAEGPPLLVAAPGELAAAEPVTPDGLQVRQVLDVDGDAVLFTASAGDPTQVGLWRAGPAGLTELPLGEGVHSGRQAGGTTVAVSRRPSHSGAEVTVLRDGAAAGAPDGAPAALRIASLAERPQLPDPEPIWLEGGPRGVRTALVLPSWHEPGSGPLPVLCDPYGGPHAQRVLATRDAYWTSQWLAEQGFAVVIADGRGTPGRGPDWERAVAGDLAGPVLADQIDALHAAAEHCGDLDLTRVGIRGWSFGGYLAALAVLRAPEVFHVAVAGAPVTDWQLYDTHYTERYLGLPADSPATYEQSSLISGAGQLTRPLMLIHGLADDNVVVAHSLRLSSALLAAGRPHTVLPLTGVTHMASQEEVAENLLLLEVGFLKAALRDSAL